MSRKMIKSLFVSLVLASATNLVIYLDTPMAGRGDASSLKRSQLVRRGPAGMKSLRIPKDVGDRLARKIDHRRFTPEAKEAKWKDGRRNLAGTQSSAARNDRTRMYFFASCRDQYGQIFTPDSPQYAYCLEGNTHVNDQFQGRDGFFHMGIGIPLN